jgi:hypothetical protein
MLCTLVIAIGTLPYALRAVATPWSLDQDKVDHYKPPKNVVYFCSNYQTISRFTTQSCRSHHLTSDYCCKFSNKISSGVCAPRKLQLYAREVKTGSLLVPLFPPRSNVSFPDFHHLSCQNVVLNQRTRLLEICE